ncbi:MAG: hypothetical protein HND44_06525 [Chloroflexi bacterium]|nr:hypothetical protein [Ardenticatenaceae bacterium]MBL1128146.1 hypothetical protein [Chloroflexota bacterium]NOG34218.1 hypothetical protein [Chloroflexota bacterium]GIK55340.1 MAG: glycoside hydrolase [Chloroflexota bacterium]
MINSPHPRPLNPLVDRNPFRQQPLPTDGTPIAPLAEIKELLPEPVLPDREGWTALYWRAWEVLWANLRQPTLESGFVSPYVAPADSNYLLMWEAAVLTQLGLYGRRAFNFMGLLNNLYAHQHDDGFICRAVNHQTGQDGYFPFDPNSTGPNMLACAEWRYFRLSGDDGRLADVFWLLLALHQWYRDNRTWPGGGYWATGVSSQMDNQPRVPNSRDHHRHWTWVDATIQAALNCNCLAQMAAHLGEADLAAALKEEHLKLAEIINRRLWNEETQFYQDVSPDGRFSSIKSIGAYWALFDNGLVPEKRLAAFVQALRENWAFNLPHRIPSISADSEAYNAETGNRWRGGVWPDMNFMALRGLRNVGQHVLAHAIACNHVQHVYQVYQDTGYFWDNYAPEAAMPGEPARKNALTACVTPIAMLLEDVLGLTPDWPHRRLYWDRRLDTEQVYGVRRYPLGADGVLDITGDRFQVTLTTNTPFTLVIRDAAQNLQTAVSAGTTTIDLT